MKAYAAALVLGLLTGPAVSYAQGYVQPFSPEWFPPGLEFLAIPTVNQVPPPNRWVHPGLSCGDAMTGAYIAKLHEYEARIRRSAGNYQEVLRLMEEERRYIEQYQEKLKTPVYGWSPYHFGMAPTDPACRL